MAYSNSDVLIHASFEGVRIAVEERLALRLSDGCADATAVASSLTRMPVADGPDALTYVSDVKSICIYARATYSGVGVEIGPESFEAGNKVYTFRVQSECIDGPGLVDRRCEGKRNKRKDDWESEHFEFGLGVYGDEYGNMSG